MLVYNVESISTKLESVIKKLKGPEMKAHTEFIKTNVVKCANLEGYKAAEILENYKSPNEVVFFDIYFCANSIIRCSYTVYFYYLKVSKKKLLLL